MYETNSSAILQQIISDVVYGGIMAVPLAFAIVVLRRKKSTNVN